jgi:heme/copper-type cytochrome/quinol oxidase subunit 4
MNGAARYHHRQTSIKAMLLFVSIVAVVTGAFLFLAQEPRPAIALMLAVITLVAIVIAVFSSLTVEVTVEELSVAALAQAGVRIG